MKLTKEQLLKDENWWLITTQYPVACTTAIYRVVQSDKDPVENMPQDEWSELVDECIESFGYLGNDFEYDETLEESEDEQYDDWYTSQKEDIEMVSERITEDTINNWGVDMLNSWVCE